MAKQDWGLTSRVGPLEVDWPRSLGYFGGVALAVVYEVVPLPFGVFIAAIPFLKMLNHPNAPIPIRFTGQVLDGVAKPVGGSSESTIEMATPGQPRPIAEGGS